jgi:regulatory protein
MGADEARRRPRGPAKDRALRLLGVRWRSREEIRTRLRQAGYEAPEIDQALDDLERVGLIDDERFAREAVGHQAGNRLAGNRAIRAALRQKGVDPTVVEEAVAAAGDQDERAYELARRRAVRLGALPPEAAYRRLLGLLLRRGYPGPLARDACRRALNEALAPGGELPDQD